MSVEIVWRYKIAPEKRAAFEFEYGPEGAWSQLFTKSTHYFGSILQKSMEEETTYLLVDVWYDLPSYHEFLDSCRQQYQQLGTDFEMLYLSEERIGVFKSETNTLAKKELPR